MTKPLISIIIPIFNAEKYIEKCLNSVLNQTLYNIEVICINDGSTDNSMSVLSDFAHRDGRLKIFSQINSGSACARNLGLKNAKGNYVWFIDADDWCEINACKLISESAINNPDIIIFGTNIWQDNNCIDIPYFSLQILDSINNFNISTHPDKISQLPATLWNKAFRRDFLNKNNLHLDEELHLCDDNLLALEGYLKASNIQVIHQNLYNYNRFTPKSLTSNNKYWKDVIKCSSKSDILIKNSKEKQYYPFYVKRNIEGLFYWFDQKGIPKFKFYKKLRKYLKKTDKEIYRKDYLQESDIYSRYLSIRKYNYLRSKFFKIKVKSPTNVQTKFLGIPFLKYKESKNYLIKKYIFGICVSTKSSISIHQPFVKKSSESKICKLKNAYKDKGRLFIIGNGNSIADMDLSPLNNENTFVVSKGFLLKNHGLNHATFYCISDRYSYLNYGNEIDLNYANYYFASSWSGWNKIPERSFIFDLSDDIEIAKHNFFQFNINSPLSLGRTVVLDALQLAVYMGFSEIYFIGVDLNFNKKERHFYKSNQEENQKRHIEWAVNNTQRMINNFEKAAQILSTHNIKIFNAGEGGNLNTIPRIDFTTLFDKEN